VHDPHNFLLEVWTTCGVGAVAALVAGLAWMLRTFCRPDDRAAESALPASTPPGSLGWEFVAGGVIGMVLTLVLRGQSMEFRGDEVLAAGLRSIVWAAAFAVLARVAWTPRAQRLALAAGVAAALLNLSLSGGIAFPAVAAPWWAAAALVLNAIEPPAARADVPGRWRWAGLLLVPVALAYLVTIWLPVVSAFNPALGAARVLAQFRGGVLAGRPRLFLPPDFQRQQLEQHVLAPLRAACAADPGNARLQVLLAEGLTELAKLAQAAQDRHEAESLGQAALAAARRAQELNPHGASMYLAGGEVYLALAAWPEDRAAEHVLSAADELKQAVNNDPTDPTMRGQRAELLFAAAEALDERARKEMAPERVAELRDRHRETTAEGRREAEEALRLDQLTVWVGRKLSPQERTRLARRLDQPQSRVQGRSP